MKYAIFGAKSTALGLFKALEILYTEHNMTAFLVSKMEGNPSLLSGYPVVLLDEFEDKTIPIVVAVPVNLHKEISIMLEEKGFTNYVCMDSYKEQELMKAYYSKINMFPSLDNFPVGSIAPKMQVYSVRFYGDKKLENNYVFPEWVIPIQAGATLTNVRISHISDDVGDNISDRNGNYCELTALYWAWKNQSSYEGYCGLFHYRRYLRISDEDILRLQNNKVDVILPYPMMCEPNILEHHNRYISDYDWEMMLEVVRELCPEYYVVFDEIFEKKYMYNYNMFIARKEIFDEYCNWLFPILDGIHQKSQAKDIARNDRYIGYLGENLLTLYFMYNKNKYNICHTERIMIV